MVGNGSSGWGGFTQWGISAPPFPFLLTSPPHLCPPSAAMNRLKGANFVSRTASLESTEELLTELLVS